MIITTSAELGRNIAFEPPVWPIDEYGMLPGEVA